MTSKIHLPNTNINQHIAFSEMRRWQSHSFGHVSFKTKTEPAAPLSVDAVTFAAAATTAVTSSTTARTAITSCTSNSSGQKLSHFWREIQGSNDWENLVEPLNPFLRQEIIRYGEFVTACYKAFDVDPNSKRYLNCKYGKRNMFREIGMENCGYEVTKYIYATPDINIPIQNGASSNCGRWIGYVAVVNDEDEVKKLGRRDIIITFRGTVTNPEWITNLMSSLTPARLDPHNPRPEVKVESGFLSLYTSNESSSKFGLESCREQLLSEVSRLINKYKGEELSITLTGHSMGSSLALLLAYDIAELGLIKRNNPSLAIPVTVFSFGGPRVGNSGFKQRCEELGVKVLRIVNVNDPITKMPGVFFNENFRVLFGGGRYEFPGSCSCYAHVGVELILDFFNMQNPSCVHDLESYINLLKFPNKSCSSKMEMMRNIIDESDIVGLDNIINKVKEMLTSHVQNMNMLPWSCVAISLVNMIQSQYIMC